MNMDFKRKLTIPYDLKQEYPVTADMAQVFEQRDRELKDILGSRDSRLALIIGPCSADREDSVLDYVTRLVPIQEKVKDKLLIIPRVYTNKPRTTGAGYKGMLHQPDPNAAPASPAPTKCCTPRITSTWTMCWPMWPWEPGPWRTSSTGSPAPVSPSPWA